MGLAVKMIFDTSGLVTRSLRHRCNPAENFEYPYVAD